MDQTPTLLLVDSDDGVIRDVTTSLSLLGISVAAVPSAAIALRVLAEFKPRLVLVRFSKEQSLISKQELKARSELPRAVRNAKVQGIPIVALVHLNDQKETAEMLEEYPGKIDLPVEFPAFTLRIQDHLGGALFAAHAADLAARTDSRTPVKSQESVEPLAEKIRAIYAVQSEVMSILVNDVELVSGSTLDVLTKLSELTQRLCTDPKMLEKIIGKKSFK